MINGIKIKRDKIFSWNQTYFQNVEIIYPKNINHLKNILKTLKKNNFKYIIKTGECSYDNKSVISDENTYVISLKNLNKISKIDNKNGYVTLETGVLIPEVVNELRHKNLTLYSIPGGSHVSIGGAISANVIGKDSSKKISCFGDSVVSLEVLDSNGRIRSISKNSKKINKFIGAFGLSGIILKAKIKTKKIDSVNVKFTTKILNNLFEVKNELENKTDYKYIQLDPFFRKKNFGIVFNAKKVNDDNVKLKKVNLNSNFFEIFFFKFSSFFINSFSWKIFYKTFFMVSKNQEKNINIYDFHYPSKYKHLISYLCKDGLSDYEFMIKKNFIKNMNQIIAFIKKNNMYAIYIVVKKIHKSKNKYFYQFNDDGYAVAMAFDRNNVEGEVFRKFEKKIDSLNLKLNLTKSNYHITKSFSEKNNSFLSLFKKNILEKKGKYI